MIFQYLHDHWYEAGGFVIIGIFIGLCFKLFFHAIVAVATIRDTAQATVSQAAQIKSIYEESWPMAQKMRDQIDKLGGEVWRVAHFREMEDQLLQFKADLNKLRNEIASLK